MRILKVCYTYYPFVEMGGPPVKVRAIAEHLVQRGNRVTVLTARYGDTRGTEVRELGGVEVVYLRSWFRYRTVTINPGAVRFLRRRVREFDVAHIYGFYDLLGPLASFYCRRSGVPYALELLGMFEPIGRSLAKKRVYHALLGRSLIRHAACVVATSERERGTLVAGGVPAERIALRRNGVDLRQFAALPPPGGFRRTWGIGAAERMLLFVGRIVWVKGLDVLLRAFAGLAYNGARLVLAGPQERDGYRELLEREVERLGLGDRVVFTGPLFGEAKLSALVDADVVVLPSRSESFGNVAVEAACCGVPVVVSDQCGVAPYVKDRAGLVVPLEADAVRKALFELLSDEALRERFRAGALAAAQALSWDEPVAQLEGLYRELLGSRRRRVAA